MKKYNYWDDLIEELKYEKYTGMTSMMVGKFIRWTLLVCVVLFLVVMFIK
jgi:hypothetical protein